MKRTLLLLSVLCTQFMFAQSVSPIYSHDFSGSLDATDFNVSTTRISLTNDRNNTFQSAAQLNSGHGAVYVNIQDNKSDLMLEGTISVWFKYNGTGQSAFGTDKPLIFWSNGNLSYSEGVVLAIGSSGGIKVLSYHNNNVGGFGFGSTGVNISGGWHHFAVSWKFGTDGFIKGYFNGEEVVTRSHNFDMPSSPSNAIYFTGFNDSYPSSLYGDIDDIRVYKKALPKAEIKHIFNPCNVNIPDANFKNALLNYTPAIDTNGDGEIQCYEAAATTGYLGLTNKNITDLTGIEEFVNVTNLSCGQNQLTTLNISSNQKIKTLFCHDNQLISLTLNDSIEKMYCDENKLTSLDLSTKIFLKELSCRDNKFTSLNLANGHNSNLQLLQSDINPDLSCIQVDDEDFSNDNWTTANGFIKNWWTSYSEDCATFLGISDVENNNNLSVYPNPTTGVTYFSEFGNVQVFDMSGRLVLEIHNTNSIDLSNQENGIYIVKTENKKSSGIARVIKK